MPFRKPESFPKPRNCFSALKRLLIRAPEAPAKPNVPRKPPAAATPLRFPRADLGSPEKPPELTYDDLYWIVAGFPRRGPAVKHCKAFNVHLVDDVSLEDMIPQTHLPSPSWLSEEPVPNVASSTFPASSSLSSASRLSNGTPAPDHLTFFLRLQELQYENDDAFDFLQRKPLAPEKPVRIAHFRKFWEKLYMVAEFWDTSKDNYQPASPKDGEEQTYTGRRIGCGAKMPSRYRDDAINAFVETIVWCFKCRVELPSARPKLGMQNMRIPVPQTGVVYRTPADRARARQGISEGPLVQITCRMGMEFCEEGEKEGSGRLEFLDLAREIGSALMTAQKRRREGTKEEKHWEGKWWAEKTRWSGAQAGEVDGFGAGPSDAAATSRDRKTFEKSKNLGPPSSEWDRNVEYMQIGKRQDREYDDIYLISSLNHHLSILRVRVPLKYIDFLTNGPPSTITEEYIASRYPWFKLQVQRSRWYDLLKPEDRAQAMRGVWGVIGWMMRDVRDVGGDEDEAEGERWSPEVQKDVEMTDRESVSG